MYACMHTSVYMYMYVHMYTLPSINLDLSILWFPGMVSRMLSVRKVFEPSAEKENNCPDRIGAGEKEDLQHTLTSCKIDLPLN